MKYIWIPRCLQLLALVLIVVAIFESPWFGVGAAVSGLTACIDMFFESKTNAWRLRWTGLAFMWILLLIVWLLDAL